VVRVHQGSGRPLLQYCCKLCNIAAVLRQYCCSTAYTSGDSASGIDDGLLRVLHQSCSDSELGGRTGVQQSSSTYLMGSPSKVQRPSSGISTKLKQFEGKGEGFGLVRSAVFGFLVLAAARSAMLCGDHGSFKICSFKFLHSVSCFLL
jgi:hypothetical protein